MEIKTRQRIALSALFFQTGLIFSTWASRIPDIKQSFNLDDSDLGALLLITPIGSLIGLPLAGWLVDKYGSRPSVGLGMLLYSMCLTLVSLAPTLYLLGIALFFFGMSGNLLNISMNAQGLAIQKSYGRVVMASFHGLWSVAGFCGAGMGMLAITFNLTIFTHFVSVTTIVIVLLTFFFPLLNREHTRAMSTSFSFALLDKQIIKLGSVAFCGLVCEGCMFDWSGVYFKQVVGAEGAMVTAGFIAFMAMMATGRFISDSLTNKFGTHVIMQASGVFIFSGLLTAVVFPYFYTSIIGFFLVGLGTSSVIPLTYSEVGKSSHISSGKAIALVSTIGYFGFLLGPPMIGFISEAFNMRVSFALVALVGLLITIIITFTKNRNNTALQMDEVTPIETLP